MGRGLQLFPVLLMKTTLSVHPSIPSPGVGSIAIRDYMVHTIADQFPTSYSIITFVNLKWFPKQKQRMSSAC